MFFLFFIFFWFFVFSKKSLSHKKKKQKKQKISWPPPNQSSDAMLIFITHSIELYNSLNWTLQLTQLKYIIYSTNLDNSLNLVTRYTYAQSTPENLWTTHIRELIAVKASQFVIKWRILLPMLLNNSNNFTEKSD